MYVRFSTFTISLVVLGAATASAPANAPTPPPAGPAPAKIAFAGVTLQSVNVTLPTGDRMFPGGAAADAINNNCVSCHSAGMVLNQPSLSRADWQGEVNKMRNVYKAPVADDDAAAIVDYLAKTKGL
jgi:hypothetical protein